MSEAADVKEPSKDKRTELLLLLAQGIRVKPAAEKLNIQLTQAYRMARSEDMQRALAAIRLEIVDAALCKIVKHADTAVETLVEVCQDKKAKGSDRINAAHKLLSNMFTLSENVELRQQIDDLQSQLDARGDSTGDGDLLSSAPSGATEGESDADHAHECEDGEASGAAGSECSDSDPEQ